MPVGQIKIFRTPFGTANDSGTFQRVLDIVLSEFSQLTCLVYLEDAIVFSKSFTDHVQEVDMVQSSLRKADVSFNLRKCCLSTDRVKYLEQIIRPSVSTIDEARVKSFEQLQFPLECHRAAVLPHILQPLLMISPLLQGRSRVLTKFLHKGQLRDFPTSGEHERKQFKNSFRPFCQSQYWRCYILTFRSSLTRMLVTTISGQR